MAQKKPTIIKYVVHFYALETQVSIFLENSTRSLSYGTRKASTLKTRWKLVFPLVFSC